MAKNTEIVVVEDTNPPPAPKQPQLQLPNLQNLFSVFSNFNLHLPFLNPPPKPKQKDATNNNLAVSAPVSVGDQVSGGKRNFVRIPNAQVAATTAPNLQVEAEESSTKTSNPIIIWQVYAIGAFFVAQWALSRWKERKDRGGSPNNDNRAEGRLNNDGSLDNE